MKIKYKLSEFKRFITMRIKIILNFIPNNAIVVKHLPKSSKLSKGKYSSWSEYWRDEIKTPIQPSNNICPCCQRVIFENSSNYFIIGHIYDVKNKKNKYLHPVCNECNVGLKRSKFIVNKKDIKPMPYF